MGYIQKVKGEEWSRFIDENAKFIESELKYGENIINLINKENRNATQDKIIILLLCEFLQNLDGIHSLYKEESIDVSMALVRSLIELTIYIIFILEDESLVEKRAIAYDIGHIKGKIKKYQEAYQDTKELKYRDAEKNFRNSISKYSAYQIVENEWNIAATSIDKKR